MAKVELDKLAGPNGGEDSRRLALHWLDQLKTIQDQAEYKRWLKRGQDIEKRYRDERNRTDEEGQRRYNALWSNVEILKPALYGKTPLPVAERRFKDKDPVGRGAAEMLERALRNEIEICNFNDSLNQAVSDYLLPGRGTVWIRYEPEIEESISLPLVTETDMRDQHGRILIGKDAAGYGNQADTTGDQGAGGSDLREGSEGEEDDQESASGDETDEKEPDEKEAEEEKLFDTGDRILRESTPVDYVNWKDFFTLPVKARIWREVTAVAKRIYMSRNQMVKRFGKEIGKAIPIQRDDRGHSTQFTTMQSIGDEDKGQVFEIWDMDTETVYWVAEGYEWVLDKKEDPLTLENFFPCPPPLYANSTTSSLIPVPDYIQYQDQAIMIDELTQRISMLSKAMKVAGVYNAAAHNVQRLLNESVENELIPVDDWAAFAEKGGMEGVVSFMPVDKVMLVLQELMKVKDMAIQEMDRLTGITDIMRGTTDARETLGGQRLKSNSAGTRLTYRQNEVARFARDTVRIMADIMCQHFSPQSIIETSGALYEEGLGPDDMPPLSELMAKPKPKPQPGQGGPPQGPAIGGPGSQGSGGSAPAGPMGPGAPQGGNVVPFPPRPGPPPPGQAPPGPGSIPGQPPGQPGQTPQGPPGSPEVPGLPVPIPQQPPWQELAKEEALDRIKASIGLMRNEQIRGFRVDIEVDSTIFPDAAQEKQDRTQFIASVTQFLQAAGMIAMQMPPSIPMLGKLLQFGVRGYRVGRDLELSIEQFAEAAFIQAQQKMEAAQNQPNPIQQKLEIEKAKAQSQISLQQSQIQNEKVRAQADVQTENIKAQSQHDVGQMDLQREREKSQSEQAKTQMDMADRQHELQAKTQQTQMDTQAKSQQVQMDTHAKMQQTQMDTQADQQYHKLQMEMEQMKLAVEMIKMQMLQHKQQQQLMQPAFPQEPTDKESGGGMV